MGIGNGAILDIYSATMNPLGDAIDKAVKEQYPNGTQPTFLQTATKKSEKERWSDHFKLQLRNAGFTIQGKDAVEKISQGLFAAGPKDIFTEFRFHGERMWRFDFALPSNKISVEIDGGGFGRVVVCHQCHQPVKRFLKSGGVMMIREGSGHNTGKAMENDHERNNAAILLGWRVLRFTPKNIKDHSAINTVLDLLKK